TLNLVRVLRSKSMIVKVLCYFESDDYIVNDFRNAGSNVEVLNLERSLGWLKLICILRRKILATHPEIVHVQYMAPGALPIIAARLAGVKWVFATVHQPYTKSHGRLAKLILRVASLFTTKFIAVSQSAELSWF